MGTDYLGDTELAGERSGMQGARAAEGGQHKIARIVPALDRHDFQDFRHRMIDNINDSSCGGSRADAKRLGKPRAHRIGGRRMIDCKLAAEQGASIEISEQEGAIRDRWLRAGPALNN